MDIADGVEVDGDRATAKLLRFGNRGAVELVAANLRTIDFTLHNELGHLMLRYLGLASRMSTEFPYWA